ncbi:MAG: HDOD domain-containing protein [Planctomycetota bacterium]
MDSITAEPRAQNDSGLTDRHQPPAASSKQSRFEALAAELFACSNASPKKLCKIIERDVALRAEVIALANSFIFSFGRPVRSLAQAVACLGYARCRQLVANKLGVEHSEEMEPEQSDRPKSDSETPQRLPGVRPYRRERLSSLYPTKNRGPRPHFLSTEPGRT